MSVYEPTDERISADGASDAVPFVPSLRERILRAGSLFDHLIGVGEERRPGMLFITSARLPDQICPHSQIQNQTTRYGNQH